MSRALRLLTTGLVFQSFLAVGALRADEPAPKPRPAVEVVFCLDTTGSMGGLISAAKQKIWAISNQIASGQPTPRVKIGLIAYRDRGDVYVTKVFDLTEDLDAIHGHLMGFRAEGGGDFPESVNQALHDAVTKINWSKDKKTLKMIFLVGDAPPHMDYADDVQYPETCKLAVASDIIINTVQCGIHGETRKCWEEICRLAEGSYVQIDAAGGPVVAVATPFDADLAKINSEISRTTLVFGSRDAQKASEAKKTSNAALEPAAAADRAAYYARNSAGTSYDLLTNVQNGTVKLESLKKEELPPEMRKMNREEQEAFLKNLDKDRKELSQKALELDRRRGAFIAKKQAEDTKNRARDSFDNQVMQILQRQAARNGKVQYVVGGATSKGDAKDKESEMNIHARLTGVDLEDRSISVEIRRANLEAGKKTTIVGLSLATDAKITEGGNALRLEDLKTELAKERVDLFITLAAKDGGIIAIMIQRTEKVLGGPQIKR